MNIVAITACPTGIAHTYMAAEKLEQAARKAGHTIKVETQGAMGIENEISAKEAAAAQAVIFACDIAVTRRERFASVPKVIEVSVQSAIKDPAGIIAKLA